MDWWQLYLLTVMPKLADVMRTLFGIALWCCPAEPGTCELVGFVDDAVST